MQVTRIAPSPTGMFHIGTARTAYFNWLVARASGGKFILRIDDTDVERNKQEYIDIILESLDWLGLDYDEIYYQSKRTSIYLETAQRLLEAGKAFAAPNGAIILSPPTALPDRFLDTIAGEIAITKTNLEQMDGTRGTLVLIRGGDKANQPTYQFCSVVDDYYMGINHIIRGVDHITNTPKQIAIWNCLDCLEKVTSSDPDIYPQFSHVGLIHKDKKKLSKRDNAASLLWYRDNGYSPDAILNFILRMGWAPSIDNKENSIIPKEKAIKMFLTEGRMRAAPSNFDQQKLDWYQKVYTR
jgi:glutamyl-tRNA synthetase